MKTAVVLVNLGGPDKIENVQPFYLIFLVIRIFLSYHLAKKAKNYLQD